MLCGSQVELWTSNKCWIISVGYDTFIMYHDTDADTFFASAACKGEKCNM